MNTEKTMSAEEFKKTWLREAGEQPGMILDVLPNPGLGLDVEKAA